jgi:hypothetical protein
MKRFMTSLALLAVVAPAQAQIQPGPNLTASGRPYLYAPRAGYIGPPIAVHRSPPFPIVYSRTGAPSIPVPNLNMPPPPLAYAPASLPPPPAPEPPPAPCVVAFDPWLPPLLNVRASPNGWIVGQLPNGTPVFPIGEFAGNWAVIAAPIPGWVFRPYLACLPPDTAPLATPPASYSGPPAIPAPAARADAPVPRTPGRRSPVPCPAGCPREPD